MEGLDTLSVSRKAPQTTSTSNQKDKQISLLIFAIHVTIFPLFLQYSIFKSTSFYMIIIIRIKILKNEYVDAKY